MSSIKKLLDKQVPLPPPPSSVFESGKTYDATLSVWCGTWNVGEAEPDLHHPGTLEP